MGITDWRFNQILSEEFFATGSVGMGFGVQNDILVPYLDYATTTFLDTLGGVLQEIIAGKKTPQQGMQDAQRDYSAVLAKK